jgi:photosystem II stability/assembly factor-like uncharacterized protein
MACPSLSTCVAVGGFDGTILRTTDGGRTWRRQTFRTIDDLHGVACPLPSTCVAVGFGGTILRSTDGGNTWRSQTFGTPDILYAVACPRPSTCVAVGASMVLRPTDRSKGTILRTTNGGRTWRRQIIDTIDIREQVVSGGSVTCARPSTCVAVEGRTILRTTNGGHTWRSQTIDTIDRLEGVACPRSSTCVAVGDRGMILRSTDGGSSWRSV